MTVPADHEQAQVARLLATTILDGEPGALLEVLRLHDDRPPRQEWHADAAAAVAAGLRLAPTGDVYVSALPRFRRSGKREALRWGRMAWADLDTPAAVAALDAFPLAPSFRVESGSASEGVAHVHAWWLLRARVTVAAVEHLNARLALALGGDAAVRTAERRLRMPGTLNRKSSPPGRVRCTRVGHDVDPLALAEALPPLPTPPPRRPSAAPIQLHSASPINAVEPAVYVAAMTGQEVGRDGKLCCPLPGHDDDRPSFHAYPEPERGWYCFGCQRGGDVFSFGALLWGLDPRADFPELRARIADVLGVRDAA